MKASMYIKPTKGKINLLLSVEDIELILSRFGGYENRLIYQLKNIDNYNYIISDNKEYKEVMLYKDNLKNILNAPLGLYHEMRRYNISRKRKFKFELLYDNKIKYWTLDN